MNRKPNVIFMFVDDLSIGDISSFNPKGKINTPNIDALAADGMRFTDSHACSALCTPSRYSLLTGDSNPLIEKGRMTMADLFHQAGYHTACVGKWHLVWNGSSKGRSISQISKTQCRKDHDALPDHEPVWTNVNKGHTKDKKQEAERTVKMRPTRNKAQTLQSACNYTLKAKQKERK